MIFRLPERPMLPFSLARRSCTPPVGPTGPDVRGSVLAGRVSVVSADERAGFRASSGTALPSRSPRGLGALREAWSALPPLKRSYSAPSPGLAVRGPAPTSASAVFRDKRCGSSRSPDHLRAGWRLGPAELTRPGRAPPTAPAPARGLGASHEPAAPSPLKRPGGLACPSPGGHRPFCPGRCLSPPSVTLKITAPPPVPR